MPFTSSNRTCLSIVLTIGIIVAVAIVYIVVALLSFAQRAEADAIMHTVVSMNVTAESVETAYQHLFLRAAGVHIMQGYRFGKAVPPADITARLRTPGAFQPIDVVDTNAAALAGRSAALTLTRSTSCLPVWRVVKYRKRAAIRKGGLMSPAPVETIPTDPAVPNLDPGMALCLSGGGYRAMIFHVGVLWRLYEAELLGTVKRISSVSGGSITAGVLGLAWRELSFQKSKLKTDFVPKVVTPLRAMAGETIDAEAVIFGSLLPGRISDRVATAYDKILFKGATLQNLPDAPRFVINATNVQSGVLWRFMKPYMRDYRVGEVKKPTIPLAQAVAASSAFPPVLSPFEMRLTSDQFTPKTGLDLQREPFTTRVILSDGGVYDNLGLETAWKRYQTILVSDAGGKIEAEEEPKSDWARHSYRILNLIDNQVRALRKRQLIESYRSKARGGAYWGIRTNIKDYGLPDKDTLNCPFDRTLALAETPTRLKRLDGKLQEQLINWGYAVTDAALRRHVNNDIPKGNFPYPASGV